MIAVAAVGATYRQASPGIVSPVLVERLVLPEEPVGPVPPNA
jgi:hypothetical protein